MENTNISSSFLAQTNGEPLTVRRYRADCVIGRFKLGQDIILEDKIKVEVLTWRWFTNMQFFGYQPQDWVQIAFVDQEGRIGDLLLKTRSLGCFKSLLYLLKNKNIRDGYTLMKMCSFTSVMDNQQYYYVDFEWNQRNNPTRTAELHYFLKNIWQGMPPVENEPENEVENENG